MDIRTLEAYTEQDARVVAINETIKIMKQIDETIAAHGGWPI